MLSVLFARCHGVEGLPLPASSESRRRDGAVLVNLFGGQRWSRPATSCTGGFTVTIVRRAAIDAVTGRAQGGRVGNGLARESLAMTGKSQSCGGLTRHDGGVTGYRSKLERKAFFFRIDSAHVWATLPRMENGGLDVGSLMGGSAGVIAKVMKRRFSQRRDALVGVEIGVCLLFTPLRGWTQCGQRTLCQRLDKVHYSDLNKA